MKRFPPYLLDRLIDLAPGTPDESTRLSLSLDQLKDTVARDVEALLNTRRGLRAQAIGRFAHTRHSILGFGLDDFASRSLASTDDQDEICRAIEQSINDHEPRLRQVRVRLNRRERGAQSLRFSIRATLFVHPMEAPVGFDAVLQTATQQYDVAPALERQA